MGFYLRVFKNKFERLCNGNSNRLPGYMIDSRVAKGLFKCKKHIKKDWDMFFVVDGSEGCITGDTKVRISGGKLCREHTIKHIYDSMHGLSPKPWDKSIKRFVRSWNGKEIRLNKLLNSFKRGKKDVYELALENGKRIKATRDHKFMCSDGWKELLQLKNNDLVMCDKPHPSKLNRKRIKLKDVALKVDFHPYKNVRSEVEVHRLIYEAKLNKMDFLKFLDLLLNEEQVCKKLIFINPKEHHIHHKDGCHYNNCSDNLELIGVKEHFRLHGNNNYANFNQGVPSYSKVKYIRYFGFEETYDLECAFPNNNFSANEIIIHNSGKSILAQQLAFYCDPKFNIARVVFRAGEFKEAIMKANKYQAIVWDEAYGGMASRKAMSATNHMLVDLMAEIRQKNLFVFLVLPSFFELDKYAAIHRSRFLFHVWHNKFERGYYSVYNEKQKQMIYLLGRKNYNYRIVKTPIIRRAEFRDFYTVDKEAYKKKKSESLRAMDKEEEDNPDNHRKSDLLKIAKMTKVLVKLTSDMPVRDRSDVCLKCGLSASFITDLLGKYKEDKYSRAMQDAVLKQQKFKMPD